MARSHNQSKPRAGSIDMRLPDELRSALHLHFKDLRRAYAKRGMGGRVGFGSRPAVLVIDLALAWTRSAGPVASDLESVVHATVDVLRAARAADVPIFFTTGHEDPADTQAPVLKKFAYPKDTDFEHEFTLDPRLERRPSEKLIAKPYDSAFKGTNLGQMLGVLGVDTVIVTGCSTHHCVYATCRDAVEQYHVVVPAEAVGDRSEVMHEMALFDLDIALGDVMSVGEVVEWLASRRAMAGAKPVASRA